MHNIWSEIAGSGFYSLAAASMRLNDPWSSVWSKLAWLGLNGRLLCGRRTSVASDRGRGEWHRIPWSGSISASSPRVPPRNSPLRNSSPVITANPLHFYSWLHVQLGVFLRLYPVLHLNSEDSPGHGCFLLMTVIDVKCRWCSGLTMNFHLIMGEMFALERNGGVDINKSTNWRKHVSELKLGREFIKATT